MKHSDIANFSILGKTVVCVHTWQPFLNDQEESADYDLCDWWYCWNLLRHVGIIIYVCEGVYVL